MLRRSSRRGNAVSKNDFSCVARERHHVCKSFGGGGNCQVCPFLVAALPRENFGILYFTTVSLGKHECNSSFLFSNDSEMASFKEVELFSYSLNYSSSLLLDSRIPLFALRESSSHKFNLFVCEQTQSP